MTENSEDFPFLPLMTSDLPNNLFLKAKQELGENDVSIQKGLSHLREFIKKKDLPNELDDDMLLKFLRVSKYDTKKTEEKLFYYCTLRRKKSDYVELLEEKFAQEVLDRKIMGLLPYRDRDGRAIVYARPYQWDQDFCNTMDLFRCALALAHFALSFPATCVSGCLFLIDPRLQRFSHYLPFLRAIKNLVIDLLSVPIRLQNVRLIYADPMHRFLFSIVQPIIPKKLSSRINIHKEGFMDDVTPLSILPYEFGGTMGDLSNDHFKEEFVLFIRKHKSQNSIFLK